MHYLNRIKFIEALAVRNSPGCRRPASSRGPSATLAPSALFARAYSARSRWFAQVVRSIVTLALSYDNRKIVLRCFLVNRAAGGWCSDAPGKPGAPLVEDVDEDSVTLSWGKPRDDGGDKVQGYVVELREKGTNKWKPLNEKSPCRDNKFTGMCY